MYLVALKTLWVSALQAVFDQEYPQPDFRMLKVGIEYPVESHMYPGIWVDYSDTAPLRQAGVNHREQVEVSEGLFSDHTRFEFEGTMSFTIVALSSLERDRLFDEAIRTFAFGLETLATSQFRTMIEDNEFIAVNARFDEIEVGGNASAPGTPWGSDEIIYERTVSLDILGEFMADPVTGDLIPLSGFKITSTVKVPLDLDADSVPPPPDAGNPWI